eukprot:scaffold3487_cov251-Pinguiococcus_pyrenoidosus.AAC.5
MECSASSSRDVPLHDVMPHLVRTVSREHSPKRTSGFSFASFHVSAPGSFRRSKSTFARPSAGQLARVRTQTKTWYISSLRRVIVPTIGRR